MKRQRLLTNRDFPEGTEGFEFIEMEEIDGKQYLYWRMGEKSIEGCFPVSVDIVKEIFASLGREYKSSGKEIS